MGLESELVDGNGLPLRRPTRRSVLTAGAALLTSALFPNVAGASDFPPPRNPLKLLELFDAVAASKMPRKYKASALMKVLGSDGLGTRARLIKGDHVPPTGGEFRSHSWVEYRLGRHTFVLDPVYGLVELNDPSKGYSGVLKRSKKEAEVKNDGTLAFEGEELLFALLPVSKIKYVRDVMQSENGPKFIDHWQTPLETKRRRKGDCEDQLLLSMYEFGLYRILLMGIMGQMNYDLEKGPEKVDHGYGRLPKNSMSSSYIHEATKTRLIREKNKVPGTYGDIPLGRKDKDFVAMKARLTDRERIHIYDEKFKLAA